MQEDENPCQIHIQISSTDRPGILAQVLEPVVGFDWDVLDIKQFVFNGLLNLSLLLGGNKSNSILGLQGALDEWAIGNGIALQVLHWEKGLRPDAPYKYRSVVHYLAPATHQQFFITLLKHFLVVILIFFVLNN